jgi:hypothetical protein
MSIQRKPFFTKFPKTSVVRGRPSFFTEFSHHVLRLRPRRSTREQVMRMKLAVLVFGVAGLAAWGGHPLPTSPVDSDNLTVWPNRASRANSDSWLVANHERIRVMRPRVLLINFSNEHSTDHLQRLAKTLLHALAESTRYHGYQDAAAPPFLQYEVFRFVDLRDADRTKGNSRHLPVKNPDAKRGYNMKYRSYFSDEFGRLIGVADPANPQRFLRLDELIDRGDVHEVWFFESGAVDAVPHSGAFEVVELKPKYDEQLRRVGNEYCQAGNGGDPDQPWTGRSVRIGCINASRGIGCFLESLGHGLEGFSDSGAVPYFTKYFRDFAGLNLREKYQLPIDRLYDLEYGHKPIRYLDEKTAVITHKGREYRLDNYIPTGGNAHFPPNGRGHYDLDNDQSVLSTIEDWRIGSGPDGRDLAKPFTNRAFVANRDRFPDCMGPWLVYWRQNMPGLDNRAKDDAGRPMKNWWVFLFY